MQTTDSTIYGMGITILIITGLSTIGLLFIFIVYMYYKEIRNIALKNVVYLCISNFVYCLATFCLPPTIFDKTINKTYCDIQGYLLIACILSNIIWCSIISLVSYLAVNKGLSSDII